MKKELKGAPVHGTYGSGFVIHHPPLKVSKVSCQMCRWYDLEDHSCAPKALGPKDHIDHWKKCQDFILDPEYLREETKARIKAVRGQKFLAEMLEKSKALIVNHDEDEKQRKVGEPVVAGDDRASKEESPLPLEEDKTIPLEGQIFLYKNHKRCVIVSQDQRYYHLKFESGHESKLDKKTLIKKHWLTKLP